MGGIGTAGFGPGSTFRFSGKPGSTESNTFRYPSAWWDVAQMDLPRSVKHLFKWCRYHVLVNPLIATVVKKMAAYPITEITIKEEDQEGFDKHKKRWEDCLFRILKIDQQQLRMGLDYHGYGNSIVSILFPFHKYLECPHCKYSQRIKKLKFKTQWDFKDYQYYFLSCPRCGGEGRAHVMDVSYKSYRDIKLIHWNVSDIDIDFNPLTQTAEYAYNVPEKIRSKILRKNRKYLEETPVVVIQALREQRPVLLNPENIHHCKVPTPTLDSNDEGWGYPAIVPALKDSFYLQVMKKAQEQVLLEHMVPLDILYPATSDASASPYHMVNLSDWKTRVETEIVKWRWDPNYKPILPVPIGHQRIGGNGRALMLTQEIRAWSEHMIAGMNVPQEFVFGGLSWSGSSVSLRMLENQFLNYRSMHQNFLQFWLVPKIAQFMGWSEVSLSMREFKMADDLQQKQLLISLNQLKKISDKTLLAEFGKDSSEEARLIEAELRGSLAIQRLQSLYAADIQNETALSQMKAQQKFQAENMPQPQAPVPAQDQGPVASGVNALDLADAYARKLTALPPEDREAALLRIQANSPQLAQLIREKMSSAASGEVQPLPERRPPRREGASI